MNNDKTMLMEQIPVKQAILKLAMPTMLSMAVVMIYNLTDTFFIGRLNDPNLVAALSLAAPVLMAVQALGNIFSNGAASYISRMLGAKENEEAKKTAATAIYTALLLGIIVTVLLIVFKQPLLSVIGTSPATFDATNQYFSIISVCAIVFVLQITFSGLIRSEGATDKSMTGMVLGIGINIILDPVFIFVFDMGVAGAAYATVIGTAAGAVYFVTHLASKNTLLSIKPGHISPSKKIYSQIFKIGIPSALSNIVMSLSMILVNIIAAGYGDHVVAGNGIQMRVVSMAFMLIMGLAQGYQPFAGYNYGAEKYDRLKEGFKITLLYSTILAVLFTIIFQILGRNLIGLFISDRATVDIGVQFIRAFSIGLPFIGLQMTMMITFQSVGKALNAMIVSLGRQCLLYLPAVMILNNLFGLNGFIFAQPIADILTAIVAVLMSLSFFRELNRLLEEQTIAGTVSGTRLELLAAEEYSY